MVNNSALYLDEKIFQLREQLECGLPSYEHLSLLDELSFYLRYIDPVEARMYARREIRIAATLRSQHWMVRGYLRYANCFSEPLSLIHRYLRKAWKLLESLPENPAEKAYVSRHLAENFYKMGQMDSALHFLVLSLSYARESNDQREIVATLGASGEFYFESGLYAEALRMMEEALSLYEELSLSDAFALNGTAHLYLSIGYVYETLGNNEQSISHYMTGLAMVEQTGDKAGQGLACRRMGSIAAKEERYEEALSWYGRAETLAKDMADTFLSVETLIAIGSLYRTQGNYGEAAGYLENAAHQCTAIKDEKATIAILIERGELFIAQRKWMSALLPLSEGIEALKNTTIHSLRSRAHQLLAKTFEGLGEFGNALQHYRHFMELERKLMSNEVRHRLRALEVYEEVRKRWNDNLSFRNKADRLEREAEHRSREMASLSLHLAKTEDLLNNLHTQLLGFLQEEGETGKRVKDILSDVESIRSSSRTWEMFEQEFQKMNRVVIRRLTARYPALSSAELRVCLLLRMGFGNQQIAELLNLSQRTVDTHRTHIRKRMGLQRSENLVAVLSAV